MTTIGYELIKTLSVLNAGRVAPPQFDGWRFIGDRLTTVRDPEPSSVTDGIDVSAAIKGFVGTRTSDDAATWQLWLKVHTADAGETYGVDFFADDSTAFIVSAAGSATLATVISNLQTAFDGSAPFASAGGVADQPSGTSDVIRITFTNLADHLKRLAPVQIGIGALADTGFQSLVPEATSVAWQLWALTKGTAEWTALDVRGSSSGPQDMVKLCSEMAGVDRHYIQVIDANGVVLPVIAPAVNELDQATAEQAAAQALSLLQAQLLTILPNDYLGRLPMAAHDGRAFDAPILIRGAAAVKRDGPITVQLTSTVLMAANPSRRGYLVRADPDNTNNVHVRFDVSGADAATTSDMKIRPGEIDQVSGDDVMGNAMLAIADTAVGIVTVREW